MVYMAFINTIICLHNIDFGVITWGVVFIFRRFVTTILGVC